MIMHNIQIDSEFQALIPPLSAEERAQLEANIVADGCRDPLVVWPLPEFTHVWDEETGESETFKYADKKVNFIDGDSPEGFDFWESSIYADTYDGEDWPHVLIDGHNRHEICTRLGLPFEVVVQEFSDREAVMDWMEDNQLGRRNLKPDAFTYLLGRKYNRQKKSQGGDRGNQYVAKDQNDTLPTADKLAVQHGVSAPTVKRAGQFADAVEVINKAAPGFAAAVNAGEAPTRQEVVKAATVVAQIPEAAQNVALAAEFADLPSEAKQEAIEAIAQLAPAQEVMREAVKKAHVANNSGNNEWYTPSRFIEAARTVMGSIDTDPATSEIANKTVKATNIFTAEDDGRIQKWTGNVWMNPPYAQPLMGDFAEAVSAKYEAGEIDQACILVNNGTETQWFQRMLSASSAVCFPKSRIKFLDPEGNASGAPLQGQAIVYMGDNIEEFKEAFSPEGKVLINV